MSESTTSACSRRIFIKPLTLNFREPIVLVLDCYLALGYSLLFAQLETYRLVFSGIYGFPAGQEGLTFLACYVGFVIAQILYFLDIGSTKSRSAMPQARPRQSGDCCLISVLSSPYQIAGPGLAGPLRLHVIGR